MTATQIPTVPGQSHWLVRRQTAVGDHRYVVTASLHCDGQSYTLQAWEPDTPDQRHGRVTDMLVAPDRAVWGTVASRDEIHPITRATNRTFAAALIHQAFPALAWAVCESGRVPAADLRAAL